MSEIDKLLFSCEFLSPQDLIEKNADDFGLIRTKVMVYASIFAVALILSFITQIIQNIIVAKVNPRFIHRLRQDAYAKIINNKVSFFDKAEAGRITSRVINDSTEKS